jgi:glycosyltransferase involved in cell wall biosynthesis
VGSVGGEEVMAMFKFNKKSKVQVEKAAERRWTETLQMIYSSGLFDAEWYVITNPDVAENGGNPLEHYVFNGVKEGRSPSYLFDVNWYLEQNPDVKLAGVDPLRHYYEYGEAEGRKPSIYFDPVFYRAHNALQTGENALAHYYKYAKDFALSPLEQFDPIYYRDTNPDVVKEGVEPYRHFIFNGYKEGRNPNAGFDLTWYCQQHLDGDLAKNGFLHYLTVGVPAGHTTTPGDLASSDGSTISGTGFNQVEVQYLGKGPGFEEFQFGARTSDPDVKILAYYLPQFHPFEQNNEWWGEGFTEWTNVTRGRPRFNGHYQPRLPRDLGFYDLRLKETLVRQAEMARNAGLEGFCFYHYWFNGTRLMDGPVNMLLDNRDIELPFCLMWANENWTRRWDGLENDVLIAQDYRDEDDEAFIADIARHFEDPRYIRIDGKPIFFVYRPGIIPDAKTKFVKWRELLKANHDMDVIIYMAQAFDDIDPRPYGLDGAIEFPPHKVAKDLPSVAQEAGLVDPSFAGHYPCYSALAKRGMEDIEFEYDVIKAVTPMWDNEARKPSRGMGFVGATPAKYEQWLNTVLDFARKNPIQGKHKFACINAWNEWAEGAYLEPDQYWGSAYLNATYRAAYGVTPLTGKYPLILVGHDAYKHGAQLLTLNIFKTLRQQFGVDAHLVILGEGPLLEEYAKIGPVYPCSNDPEKFKEVTNNLADEYGISRAICNTTVSGRIASIFKQAGVEFISLVHELENLIHEYQLEPQVNDIAKLAKKVIFAAQAVQDSFVKVADDVDADKLIIHPQGIYQTLISDDAAYANVRKELNIPADARLIVNVGFADLRKGFDIFVNVAKVLVAENPGYHFLWIGDIHQDLKHWLKSDMEGALLKGNFHNIPFTNEISKYLCASDVFAMTSREDPFPSVVMEALALGTPVVGVEGGGGFTELLVDDINGSVVPMADIEGMAVAISEQAETDSSDKQQSRAEAAKARFSWDDYVFSLLQYLDPSLKKVTVSIPNYNYENYIAERLRSVFAQHYPVFEVLVLDDVSPDNSVNVIKKTAEAYERKIDLIINEENSGSVFKQWKKGVDLARGDYLWIAEADDSASEKFLSAILESDTDFAMAYTDSAQIDENSKYLADNYRYYYDQPMIDMLDASGVCSGVEVIENCLSIKNQLMNVSSVLFDTDAVRSCMDEHFDEILKFKVAGDWFVYVQLLSMDGAKAKLIPEGLNVHRRHSGSVTRQNYDVQLQEILDVQALALACCNDKRAMEGEQSKYISKVREILEGEL